MDEVDRTVTDMGVEGLPPGLEYGNREGRYFTPWRWKELLYLAVELYRILPQATGWKIWYDSYHDFHRLEFDVEGHHYAVQYYKVFAVIRDNNDTYLGEFAKKNYGRTTWYLEQLFRSGRFRTWSDPPESY